MSSYMKAYKDQTDAFIKVHRLYAERALEFGAGQRGFVANGQVTFSLSLHCMVRINL